MRRLLFCGLILLTACQDKTKPQDWRVQQIDRAETKIRAEISDPTAQFSKVQLTGDDKTGQTCGEVFPTHGQPQRFIVYIDGAGPFIEGGLGPQPMAQESFDSAWYNDCVSEGYAP